MKKLFIIMLVFCMSSAFANTKADYRIDEFATMEALEAAEMDEAAAIKIRGVIPRIAKRFCHLKVRPVYVTVSIYLVQVQWSLDRICGEAMPVEIVNPEKE